MPPSLIFPRSPPLKKMCSPSQVKYVEIPFQVLSSNVAVFSTGKITPRDFSSSISAVGKSSTLLTHDVVEDGVSTENASIDPPRSVTLVCQPEGDIKVSYRER